MQPCRLERELCTHEVQRHRYQDCDFYSECVRICGVYDWASFSCVRCIFYVKPQDRHPRMQKGRSHEKGKPKKTYQQTDGSTHA